MLKQAHWAVTILTLGVVTTTLVGKLFCKVVALREKLSFVMFIHERSRNSFKL